MGSFLEWMLESSLLVIMILGIRRAFMGKIRYAGIYALWLVVLLRFLVPVNIISTPISIGNIISANLPAWVQEQEEGRDTVLSGAGIRGLGKLESARVKLEEGAASPDAGAVQANLFSRLGRVCWRVIFRNIWLAVSAFFFLWLVLSNVCLIRRLKRNRAYYGKRGNVKIYTVSGFCNPCLYGFFRPVIYLPQEMVQKGGADGAELEQMITHEYVHYRHGDHIWAMFRVLLVSVYWFDPFLWLAVSGSKKDAELFCDETVIRMLGEEKRLDYGKMLVRLASDARWGDFRYPVMPMSRRGRELEKRILAISNPRRYSRWVLIPLITAVLTAAGITCSTGVKPMARNAKAAMDLPGSTPDKTPSGTEGKASVLPPGDIRPSARGTENVSPEASGQEASYSGAQGENSAQQEENAADADNRNTIEAAFQAYIDTFTDAVNTGNTGNMSQVLATGSRVYRQQCDLVKNYYKRGIHEAVKSCTISSVNTVSPNMVTVDSRERIKVYYGDGTTKLVKQKYRYTCEYREKGWIITGMDEI